MQIRKDGFGKPGFCKAVGKGNEGEEGREERKKQGGRGIKARFRIKGGEGRENKGEVKRDKRQKAG